MIGIDYVNLYGENNMYRYYTLIIYVLTYKIQPGKYLN